MCEYYPGTVCRRYGSIGMDYVYIDTSMGSFEEYDEKITSVSIIMWCGLVLVCAVDV